MKTIKCLVSIPLNLACQIADTGVRVAVALSNNFATGLILGFGVLYYVIRG